MNRTIEANKRNANSRKLPVYEAVDETRDKEPRILIVDDNLHFGENARQILQATGQFTVCIENNPIRALETARGFKPDLMLVDLIMPEIDGTEVATQIESDWTLHGVPIVFVTSLITAEEASDGRRIDGHRILPKPISGSELIRIVEQNLPHCAEA